MKESKKKIYEYSKELYNWELARKESLNNSISVPLAIITLQIGSYSALLTNIPLLSIKIINIIFYSILLISLIPLAFSIYYFFRHQIGFTYGYVSSPKELNDFYNSYVEYLATTRGTEKSKDELLIEKIDETVLTQMISHTERNMNNNEKKILYYKRLKLCNIVATIVIVLMIGFYAFSEKKDEPTKIEIVGSNIQGGQVMAGKPSDGGKNPKPAPQPVPPQAPMGRLVTEGLDPSNIVKPEIPKDKVVNKKK